MFIAASFIDKEPTAVAGLSVRPVVSSSKRPYISVGVQFKLTLFETIKGSHQASETVRLHH